jgi:hypothetical protein
MSSLAVLDSRGERAINSEGWKEPSGRQKWFGWRDGEGHALTVQIDDIASLVENVRGGFTIVVKSIMVDNRASNFATTYMHNVDMATGFRLMKIMGWSEPT